VLLQELEKGKKSHKNEQTGRCDYTRHTYRTSSDTRDVACAG